MRFIAPRVLYLLLLVLPLAAALLIRAAVRRRKELDKVLSPLRDREAAVCLSVPARILRQVALVAAVAALVFAAARPYWSSKLLPTTERGRDIAVVFDVSKSMLAKDIAPSRLEHAKFLLRDLASRLPGDRFGLIAFAGRAYVACPLTADPVAFDEYVNELSPAMVPLGGTNLELALREVLRLFRSAGGERAVVVLTDGDELSGNAAKLANELKEKRIPLFIVGLGDPAVPAPLPDENGHLRRDGAGRIITSKLNEAALQKLAQATGGVYVRSTVADTGAEVVASHLAALGANAYDGGKRSTPEEKFPYFLIAAALLLAVFMILPERRARRLTMTLVACFAAAAVPAGPPPPPAAAAPAAEKLPEAPAEKLPADPVALYNLGVAKQSAGEPDAARLCYEKVLKHRAAGEKLRMKSLFNLGVAEHRAGRGKLAAARQELARQQPDKALAELETAQRGAAAAGELYAQALGSGAAAEFEAAAVNDLQLLERDRKAMEKLKKQIEELKKQQRQAQQSAKNAQRQNQKQQQNQQNQGQQNQQQQQQQQNQGQQNQQQQQGRQNQDQPQNQQQQGRQKPDQGRQKQDQQQNQQNQQPGQQQQPPQSASDAARRESEKLREQAEKLGQKELEKHAAKAAEELKKAQEAQEKNDPETAQKHLDNAVRELGSGEEKPQPDKEKPGKPDQKNEARSGEKPGERKPGAPQPAEPKPQAGDRKGAEQLLKLLNDEEKQRRDELRKIRDTRRPRVEKDW